MIYVYIGCLTFGVLYSIISAVLGHHDFDHGDVDGSGFDVDLDGGIDISLDADLDVGIDGGVDASHCICHDGGIHEHSNYDSADAPSPFSPVVMASAIATFGAIGIIGKLGFNMGDLLSAIVALSFAGAIGAAIFFGIVKFMYKSQSNSVFSQADFIGIEADITTPISASGVGEITFQINGMRRNFPARSANNEDIPRGVTVKIKDVSGNIAFVTRKRTIYDLGLLEQEEKQLKENKEINNN